MGYGRYCVTSPRMGFSTEDYKEWVSDHYHDSGFGNEKIIPKSFCLPYCDECEKYREFVDNICSNHRSHRTVITCNVCQNDFKTFNTREV